MMLCIIVITCYFDGQIGRRMEQLNQKKVLLCLVLDALVLGNRNAIAYVMCACVSVYRCA